MIANLLIMAETQTRTTFLPCALLIFLVCIGFVVLVIIGLIRLVRYLGSAGKEQKLMRMEMGKLAEEVHLLRKELKGDSSNRSR